MSASLARGSSSRRQANICTWASAATTWAGTTPKSHCPSISRSRTMRSTARRGHASSSPPATVSSSTFGPTSTSIRLHSRHHHHGLSAHRCVQQQPLGWGFQRRLAPEISVPTSRGLPGALDWVSSWYLRLQRILGDLARVVTATAHCWRNWYDFSTLFLRHENSLTFQPKLIRRGLPIHMPRAACLRERVHLVRLEGSLPIRIRWVIHPLLKDSPTSCRNSSCALRVHNFYMLRCVFLHPKVGGVVARQKLLSRLSVFCSLAPFQENQKPLPT